MLVLVDTVYKIVIMMIRLNLKQNNLEIEYIFLLTYLLASCIVNIYKVIVFSVVSQSINI